MIEPVLFAAVFLSFLLLAAHADLMNLRIPNGLTLSMAVTALPAVWLLEASGTALPVAFLAGITTLAITWSMFELGWLGGGDAKLAAAAALWLGPQPMLVFVLATALFGAVLAGILLMLSRSRPALAVVGPRWQERLTAEAISVPYAVAMAPAGAVAVLVRLSF